MNCRWANCPLGKLSASELSLANSPVNCKLTPQKFSALGQLKSSQKWDQIYLRWSNNKWYGIFLEISTNVQSWVFAFVFSLLTILKKCAYKLNFLPIFQFFPKWKMFLPVLKTRDKNVKKLFCTSYSMLLRIHYVYSRLKIRYR